MKGAMKSLFILSLFTLATIILGITNMESFNFYKSTYSSESIMKTIEDPCSGFSKPNWSTVVDPLFKLRADKLLYPSVWGGPNNQMDGILQSLYLAINLNRSIVLPMMYTHRPSDKYSDPKLPAYQRIDVDKLRQFASVISIKQMQTMCNGSFDVVFITGDPYRTNFKNLEKVTNLTLFMRRNETEGNFVLTANKNKRNSTNISFISAYAPPEFNKVSPHTEDLRKLYSSKKACAADITPRTAIKVKYFGHARSMDEKYTRNKNVSQIPDNVLYSACAEAIQHPKPVVDIAMEFISRQSNNNTVVFLHWRYDEYDFQRSICNHPKYKAHPPVYCLKLKFGNPEIILNGVLKKVDSILEETGQKIGLIYLATPPSIIKTFAIEMQNFSKSISSSINFLTNIELEKFVQDNCRHCIEKWDSEVEFFSLLEMEIGIHSNILFYSTGSTWSGFVLARQRNIKNGKAFPILSVIQD